MADTGADNEDAGRARPQPPAVLLVRVKLVSEAIEELQRRCTGGYILFRCLLRRLRPVLDGLLLRSLFDARAEQALVDLAEFVGLLRLAASGRTVITYDYREYCIASDPKTNVGVDTYVGLARGALQGVDDLLDAIVLHPIRARFAQQMMARAYDLFAWVDGSSVGSADWTDGESFVRDHREQLAVLVAKL